MAYTSYQQSLLKNYWEYCSFGCLVTVHSDICMTHYKQWRKENRSSSESVYKNKLKYWDGHLVPKVQGYREIYLHTFWEKLSFSKDSYMHPSQHCHHLWSWTTLLGEFQGPVTLSLKLFSIFLFLNVFHEFSAMIRLVYHPKQRINPNLCYSPTVYKGKVLQYSRSKRGRPHTHTHIVTS